MICDATAERPVLSAEGNKTEFCWSYVFVLSANAFNYSLRIISGKQAGVSRIGIFVGNSFQVLFCSGWFLFPPTLIFGVPRYKIVRE